MTVKNRTKLTPRERLTQGLAYTAVGPVDVTRGLVGLGAHATRAGAVDLRRRLREGRLAADLQSAQETVAVELAAAQEAVTGLPQALRKARRAHRHGQRRWVIAGVVVVVTLAAGAAAFSIVRRSSHPEPSARPPSVDVQQQP
jgi:hypothetical protein